MTNQEWIDMLRVIPEQDQNSLVLVLQNGCEISVDTLFRLATNFLVLRGRVGGTSDESRAFFVPYDQMLYFRIERITTLSELRDLMVTCNVELAAPLVPGTNQMAEAVPAPSATPTPPVTDATANRNALLDRIRAARATQVASNRQMTR